MSTAGRRNGLGARLKNRLGRGPRVGKLQKAKRGRLTLTLSKKTRMSR